MIHDKEYQARLQEEADRKNSCSTQRDLFRRPGGIRVIGSSLEQTRVWRGRIGLRVKLGKSTMDGPGRTHGAEYLRAITFHRAGVARPGAHARQEQARPRERQGTPQQK